MRAETRCRETTLVLTSLGVDQRNIFFVGVDERIPDGGLIAQAERAFSATLSKLVALKPFSDLYTMSWEGGHADHDAAHLVAIALADTLQITRAYHSPLYNGYRTPGRLFRVMRPLPSWSGSRMQLTLVNGLRSASLCLRYPSQARTWLGLGAGVFRQYVLQRHHVVYDVDRSAILSKPHDGALLYERMFATSYANFARESEAFIAKHIVGALKNN